MWLNLTNYKLISASSRIRNRDIIQNRERLPLGYPDAPSM